MNVWVHSPFRLLAQSLQSIVNSFGFHASLECEAKSEVALWDLSMTSAPFPEPPSLPTLALCSGSEADKIALLHRHYHGYLSPNDDCENLKRALLVLRRGEIWAEGTIITKALDRAILPQLTSREDEILRLVRKGLSNRAIARQLDITERTVKAHVSKLFSKMGVHGRVELILYVREHSEKAPSPD